MSYTPNEPAAVLSAEQAWLSGALITGTGYGIVASLFLLCFQILWNRLKRKDVNRRRNFFFLVYVCIMFVLGSLFLGSNSKFTQLAFINNRGYPGGPSAYEQQMFSISADEVSNVSYVLANWLADSLLVWRCVIIYRDFSVLFGRIAFIITGLMQLASYILGMFFLLQISSPSSSPYTNAGESINWTIPYFFVSLAINIVVTFLIVIRLLLYKRMTVRLLGPGHATECTTIVAMLIESAAIYSTFSLLFIIPFAVGNSVSYTFLQVLGEAQLIAPLLIILREAQGKGWISSATSVASTTVVHGDGDGVGERNGVRIARFTDIRFASELSGMYGRSRSEGTYTSRTSEFTSKRDSASSPDPHLVLGMGVEEVQRVDDEGIELREL